jgi:hypothetical protein
MLLGVMTGKGDVDQKKHQTGFENLSGVGAQLTNALALVSLKVTVKADPAS